MTIVRASRVLIPACSRFVVLQAGADDIKKHKWFQTDGSYWEDMLAKKIAPPIRPEVGNESDTTNFECVAA